MTSSNNFDRIRTQFHRELERQRQELMIFTLVSNLLLIPIVLTVIVWILTLVSVVLFGVGLDWAGFLVRLNGLLGLLVALVLCLPNHHRSWNRQTLMDIGVVLGIFLLLIVISSVGWLSAHALSFAVGYLITAIALLAALGRLYAPHESHFYPFQDQQTRADLAQWNNPFTLADDVDRIRASAGSGFAAGRMIIGTIISLVNFILDSYATMFSYTWLWTGLSKQEETLAVRLLMALGQQDDQQAKQVLIGAGKKMAGRVFMIMSKMRLVYIAQGKLMLDVSGETILL
jgi:hypothetical protein